MMPRILVTVVLVLACVSTGAATEQTCFGPGDINADSVVGSADLVVFGQCMAGPDEPAPPGCDPDAFGRADLDGEADVDLRDFAALGLLAGESYFAYGPRRASQEAELLAMELAGTLRAPDAEYDRIVRDLGLIRQAHPELVSEPDSPDFLPTQLLVGMNGPAALGADYAALNAHYLLVDEEDHGYWRLLTFCDNLNMVVLAGIYAALPEVSYAEPNYLYGIDNYYTVSVNGTTYRYDIDDGFHDCFDGCDCHRHYIIDVDAEGNVTLVLYEEYGLPWCEFSR